jgi:predicted DNA-binding transcriptional regulator YafY
VDAFLRRGGGAFRSGTVRGARIRFRQGKSAWVSKLELHPGQRLQFELDGSVVLEIPEIPFLEALGLVLQQGGDAAVIAPKELAEAVRTQVDRLGILYRG